MKSIVIDIFYHFKHLNDETINLTLKVSDRFIMKINVSGIHTLVIIHFYISYSVC